MTKTDPTPPELRPFSEWLTDHARGLSDDDMTAAMAEVTEAVSHLGKPGKVTLVVSIEPAGGGGRTVSTAVEVTAKPPKPDPEKSIFFVDGEGGLHRDDPFQAALPNLRRVNDQPSLTDKDD